MTAREAAARWGVSPQRVRVWLAAGRIPGAKLIQSPAGPYWVIPEDSKPPTPLPPGKKPQ
ncbi:MAG: helix-turn-helix domain-containing protein [Fimbriimonadaceae bacterium]